MIRISVLKAFLNQTLLLFTVAVALNYPWEVAQAPLYDGFERWNGVWWHCFLASLGDGLLVWLILLVGWGMFKRYDWYRYRSRRAVGLMLVTGLSIGISVEWVAVYVLSRWTYTMHMPLVPGLGVGLAPVLQMLLLPPLIFFITARWAGKHDTNSTRPQQVAR